MNEKKDNVKKISPKGSAGDDRNLVLVDEDFQDADFEDRVWLMWSRHGKKIITIASLIFFSALAIIIYVNVKAINLQNLLNDCAKAQTIEEKKAFANANESKPIAGIVYFDLANEFIQKKEFKTAANYYKKSADAYAQQNDPIFKMVADRARISEATALLSIANDTKSRQEGKTILKNLSAELETNEIIRGQALYDLAVLALSENDFNTAKKQMDEMDRVLIPGNMWLSKKQVLLQLYPQLIQQLSEKKVDIVKVADSKATTADKK